MSHGKPQSAARWIALGLTIALSLGAASDSDAAQSPTSELAAAMRLPPLPPPRQSPQARRDLRNGESAFATEPERTAALWKPVPAHKPGPVHIPIEPATPSPLDETEPSSEATAPEPLRRTPAALPGGFPSIPLAPAPEALQPETTIQAAPGGASHAYGTMSASACISESGRRGLPIAAAGAALGVLAPVRLMGPLHGISFRSGLPEKQRKTSIFEIFDCRLVLALDDLAVLLARKGIVEVIHMSAYRPPAAKHWREGQLGTRHTGALALDAGVFVKKDGSKLSVEKDYHGAIGQKPCGENSGPSPATPQAVELRRLTCDLIAANLFQVVLTPGFNAAHFNHFHIEVSAKAGHFYIR
jgi:hypothetical protein